MNSTPELEDLFDPVSVERKRESVSAAIRDWATKHAPSDYTPLELPCYHDPLDWDRHSNEFNVLLVVTVGHEWFIETLGYGQEPSSELRATLWQLACTLEWDHTNVFHVYSENDAFSRQIERYNRFRWILELSKRETYEIHVEVYKHLRDHPQDLRRIGWRGFEVLLDRTFANFGYRTELGPGRGDGGVDLRLYQNDIIGESLTIVQAKDYARPIDLEKVAALSGVVNGENAERGLLVTTSRFLPSAATWAATNARRVKLADFNDVLDWVARVSHCLERFLMTGDLDTSHYERRPETLRGPLVGQILLGHRYPSYIRNYFAKVVAETRFEAVIGRLPTQCVTGDGQAGTEVPILVDGLGESAGLEIAMKDGEVMYCKGIAYRVWDGKPAWFDCD
jgi:restriction system protein